MTEKELEILFRKKFDAREVPFDASGWTNIERMLDARRVAVARRRRTLWGSATALAAASIAAFFTLGNAEEATYVPNTYPVVLPIVNDDNSITESYLQQWEASQDASSSVIASSNQSSSSPSATSGVVQPSSTTASLAYSRTSAAVERNNEVIAVSSSPSNELAGNTENSGHPVEETSNTSAVVATNHTAEITLAGNVQGSVPNRANAENSAPAEMGVAENEESNLLAKAEIAVTSRENAEEKTANEESSDELASLASSDKAPIAPEDIQVKKKSASPSVAGHRFGAEANINQSSIQGDAGQLTAGSVGFTYDWMFSGMFGIHTGVGYSMRAAGPQDPGSSTKTYSFGSRVQTLDIQATRMDYFDLPIQFVYAPSKRHQFKLGGYASALATVENNVTETNTYSNADQTIETRKAYGYEEPYSKIDAGLAFGYAFSVTDKLRIQADYWQGLTDFTTGAASGNNTHIQVRLGVNYSLF